MKEQKKNKNIDKWLVTGQVGVKTVLSNFLSLSSIDLFPHAFLFIGPMGVGKYELAREFISKISQQFTIPAEVLEYNFSGVVDLNSFRTFISMTSLTTAEGGKRIVILRNFDKATPGASNSLLKTLEAPASSTIFVLISNTYHILSTIVSRCVVMRSFPIINPKQLVGITDPFEQALSSLPALAKQLAGDKQLSSALSVLLHSILDDKGYPKLMLIPKLLELEANELKLLFIIYSQYLLSQLTKRGAEMAKIISNLKTLQEVQIDLEKKTNPKLALQQFIIQTQI